MSECELASEIGGVLQSLDVGELGMVVDEYSDSKIDSDCPVSRGFSVIFENNRGSGLTNIVS